MNSNAAQEWKFGGKTQCVFTQDVANWSNQTNHRVAQDNFTVVIPVTIMASRWFLAFCRPILTVGRLFLLSAVLTAL